MYAEFHIKVKKKLKIQVDEMSRNRLPRVKKIVAFSMFSVKFFFKFPIITGKIPIILVVTLKNLSVDRK
jgi:hypothetical protein